MLEPNVCSRAIWTLHLASNIQQSTKISFIQSEVCIDGLIRYRTFNDNFIHYGLPSFDKRLESALFTLLIRVNRNQQKDLCSRAAYNRERLIKFSGSIFTFRTEGISVGQCSVQSDSLISVKSTCVTNVILFKNGWERICDARLPCELLQNPFKFTGP